MTAYALTLLHRYWDLTELSGNPMHYLKNPQSLFLIRHRAFLIWSLPARSRA